MATLNKVQLIGRLGQDPIVKDLGSTKVANFSLATDESYKGKDGNKVEQTEWHTCKAFGKLAEIIEKYVHKGSQLYVEGKIRTETWDKDGVKQYKTVINVDSIQMLDSKNGPAHATEKPAPEHDNSDPTDDLPF